jgi:hypothetical protein
VLKVHPNRGGYYTTPMIQNLYEKIMSYSSRQEWAEEEGIILKLTLKILSVDWI